MNKPNRPLSVAQLAARFQVDRRTILRYISRGYFPGAFQIGPATSAYVIPLDDVLAYEKKLASDPSGSKAS